MNSLSTNEIVTALIAETSRFIAEKYTTQRTDIAINEARTRLHAYLDQSDIKRSLVYAIERAESSFRVEASKKGIEPDAIQVIISLPLSDNPKFKELVNILLFNSDSDVQLKDISSLISDDWTGPINKDEISKGIALYLSILRTELLRTDRFAEILRSLQIVRMQDSDPATLDSLEELGKIAALLAGDITTDAPPPDVSKKKK